MAESWFCFGVRTFMNPTLLDQNTLFWTISSSGTFWLIPGRIMVLPGFEGFPWSWGTGHENVVLGYVGTFLAVFRLIHVTITLLSGCEDSNGSYTTSPKNVGCFGLFILGTVWGPLEQNHSFSRVWRKRGFGLFLDIFSTFLVRQGRIMVFRGYEDCAMDPLLLAQKKLIWGSFSLIQGKIMVVTGF